ncbi:protein FAM83E [Hoplias malabaricus]|uniref:protein FAM83E n=1 Tax=Hoplias malabaricus TaxID=27720 RepID=UPI00346305F5
MNSSQLESLDENVVFSPVSGSSPEFLHCEAERCALEQLLATGPESFYTKLSNDRLIPFLSPEEVNQVCAWAEDYRVSEALLDDGALEGEADSQDYSVQYFPVHSDTPAPRLDLGWPEKAMWEGVDQAMVYTNPPVDQMPHTREVVRKLIQGATTVIAIVTDRLTDSAVIADLYCAASRGVPVYIILNRRSVQENFTPNRLRHPNIRLRTVGGKMFFSRDGKMVVGELKENFVLVDLQTVVLGNYSLTWTDVHLHRQLITVLKGPTVESFDQEFRILYASSLPITDSLKCVRPVGVPNADTPHTLYQPEYLELHNHKPVLVERASSPPPPPTDCPLDWEALGVVQWNQEIPDNLLGVCEEPLQSHSSGLNGQLWVPAARRGFDVQVPAIAKWTTEEKLYPSVNTELRYAKDHHNMYGFTRPPGLVQYRRRSVALDTECENWEPLFRPREHRTDMKLKEKSRIFSHTHREDTQRVEQSSEENTISEDSVPELNGAATNHKKPIILSVPHTESFSSLSDILKKINARKSGKEQQKRAAKTTISRSMLDLSAPLPDTGQTNSFYESFPLTPALALIKKRNDDIKSGLLRPPRTFLPSARPRSSSFAWRFGLHKDKGEEDI